MSYCGNCMHLTDEKKCPVCGSKRLRDVVDNDPVFLMERDALTSASIEDILGQNGIPCQLQGLTGAGVIMKLGYTFETFHIFVPYGEYERAKDLLSNFFNEEETPDYSMEE